MRSNFGTANSNVVFGSALVNGCSVIKVCVKVVFFFLFFVFNAGVAFSQQTFTAFAVCNNHTHCLDVNNNGGFTPCSSGSSALLSVSGSFTASSVSCGSSCVSSCLPSSVPSGNIQLPSGATVVDVQGFVSCSGSCGSQSGNSCNVSCSTSGGLDVYGQLVVVYTLPSDAPLPPCSTPILISAEECLGGNGIQFVGNMMYLQVVLANMFPDFTSDPPVPAYNSFPNAQPEGDTLMRSDGSRCSYFNQGSGPLFTVDVCPLGFAETCEEDPSQPRCQSSSDSQESSSDSQESSSGSQSDLCSQYPNLPGCANNDICVQYPNLPGCGDGGNVGDCTDLRDCDWARVDVQLIELGVAVEIRDKIGELAGLIQAGYNIGEEQTGILNGILGAIGAGNGNVVDAIGNGAGGIMGAIGNGTQDIVGAINGLANGLVGNGGGGGISDGVLDGLGQFFNDTAGALGGFGGGSLDSLFGSYGDGGGLMGDSLGNGLGARARMNEAIGIRGEDFNFFGTGGVCPVFDVSFSTGVMGIGCSGACRVDLCDVYGFNFGAFLKSVLWLGVLIGSLFFDLEILRRGGH